MRGDWRLQDHDSGPDAADPVYPNVKDAIEAALDSGMDVYVHADDCPDDRPIGPTCPCHPLRLRAAQAPSG